MRKTFERFPFPVLPTSRPKSSKEVIDSLVTSGVEKKVAVQG
jgi:hypothetical protein